MLSKITLGVGWALFGLGFAARAQTTELPTSPTGTASTGPAVELPSSSHSAFQLKYGTNYGQITFFSSTPIEDIESQNQQVAAMVDLVTGRVAFSAPMRAFHFKRHLMEEHFHENYAESDKYPKATFSGKLLALPAGAKLKKAPQPVEVQGFLTIHGVKRKIKVPGTLEIKDDQLLITSTFAVAPADYNIEIPSLVRDNIAKSVDVKVLLVCTQLP
ncbi:YceI family protein [Hymenobacter chitinivorans]|uniref:YceI-like domain-containing protein n=1 Tax=Hymenobacter chitinivorans DSM 11115 TaxID=1121954 RepID=A0A2M9BPP9_9BACT|nr:YceI family protein [Hymenobacter chitinivorans]PJJ59892.1 YceI-like domain-containing protein [Hymenobacter chitinivorans DSM 11115]